MKKLVFLQFIVLCVCDLSNAQDIHPSVAIQTGFAHEINTHFKFSHLNNYLYGYSDFGEFILWEVKSGKQVKKISPLRDIPDFFYSAQFAFSDDEQHILIPEFPQGNYYLYNVKTDKIVFTFTPAFPEEKYTNAVFSADGSRVMLLAQVGGNSPYCRIQIKDVNGRQISNVILNVSKPFDTDETILLKLLMGRKMKLIKKTALIGSFAASPALDKVWFAHQKGELFTLNLSTAPKGRELTEHDCSKISFSKHRVVLSDLTVSNNQVFGKGEEAIEKAPDGGNIKLDSIYIINTNNHSLEKVVVSKFLMYPIDNRSNCVTTLPLTTGSSINTYFQLKDQTSQNYNLVCKDINTDKELFTYNSGDPVFYYTKEPYKEGRFNGGYVVAISDDQTMVAECTREMVIHNTKTKSIVSSFSPIRGNLRLNSPLFLDSNRLLIPKIYNDAFIVDLKSANVERLKREIDCQDTARNGVNTFFMLDNTAQIGLQNSCVSSDKKQIAITNYIPNTLCNQQYNKAIEIFDTDRLQKIGEYKFNDLEYTYHLNMIPKNDKKFLVNHRLFDFSETNYSSKELKIIQKKDTFFAVNPVYITSTNCIFSILGTRALPGSPNIIFAQWDLNGKLMKSYTYQRKKNKLDYQSYILEAKLSPDSSKLLFGLHDGTAGVFDMSQMKVTTTFEHGKPLEMKSVEIYGHNNVIAGCFIDNDQFVTNGNDGDINLWSIRENKLIRTVNKVPVMLYGLSLSPDKKYLIGNDMDKSIVFINFITGDIDLRFMAFNYESYALVNKEGYYKSNRRSNNDLSFLYKGRSYEFSQFDLYLNRPDKIIEQLGYASGSEINFYKKAYEKRLEKIGFKQASLSMKSFDQAPQIELLNLPKDLRETSSQELSFLLSARDGNSLISKVYVTVNGVPLYGRNGMELKPAKFGLTSIPVKVPLSFGMNRIEVSVMNSIGAESLREYITIKRKGQKPPPNFYLVSIGSGQFSQSNNNLKFPGKDAADVINLFKDQASHYGKINSIILQGENVNRANIIKIKEQLRKTNPDDFVIAFFAGHGMLDKNMDYYLSTYNTDFSNPSKNSISYQDFESLLDSIPARNKVMLIDACHSGELDKESVGKHIEGKTTTGDKVFRSAGTGTSQPTELRSDDSFKLMQSLFSDLRRSTGTSIIAAASAFEYAIEGEQWKNGVFTYSLQKGLKERKADLNKDGKIYLSELLEFLQIEVQGLTNGSQQPTSRFENIVNDLLIWN